MGASCKESWLLTRTPSWTIWLWMFALLLLAASAMAAEPNFPVLSGRVVDDAGIDKPQMCARRGHVLL